VDKSGQGGREGQFWLIFCGSPLWTTPKVGVIFSVAPTDITHFYAFVSVCHLVSYLAATSAKVAE